jgi:acetylornithine deacetylase/succinyl-diaminopimelate desuccinylase-like protein
MDRRQQAVAFAKEKTDSLIVDIKSIVAIPTISMLPENRADMQRAAVWISKRLENCGLKSEIFETGGSPAVFAAYQSKKTGAKTVLIYGHYDVQPIDPLDEWKIPPFEPIVLNDQLYGRGGSDMKGQMVAAIGAVEAILAQGDPGINIKFIMEGEEEISSPHLPAVLKAKKDLLTCDVILNMDGEMVSKETPTITYGLRGLARCEIVVRGPAFDLHSGYFGGVVENPAQVLCNIISSFHTTDGKIAIAGFYDHVRQVSQAEREKLKENATNEEQFLEQTGAPSLWGESAYTLTERVGARPTLEVNGIVSGFTGVGNKSIIPAEARAKVSCRLVPDQTPEEILDLLEKHIRKVAPKTVTIEIREKGGGYPVVTEIDQPGVLAASQAFEKIWGRPTAFVRGGGTIAITSVMQKELKTGVIITGFSLPEDHVHSPNEKLDLNCWKQGLEALIHFFYNYAEAE